ncbi:RNA polymerase sigma-70 factor, ECF subfamily [Dyadobacter sp. SG02]|uniref:RNA polymerase sigma-70 factor n=1 Tax=Dyadobacter sp. SG02 TaxID=1855291 RepID=UPI0008D689BD|nr:RNA polymerase sigma-70 factor [Dyadobacter sp. SG02]SEI52412.1 RNA polymerase sigma-70 factor, ECF subfamily [Dyadobacter sp. SG02]
MGVPDIVSKEDQQELFVPSDLNFLFRRYFDRLVYFSMQIVRDKDIARDLVQDAFIRYWQNQETIISSEVAAKNFLYVSVRNASFNHVRHNKVVEDYAGRFNSEEMEEASVMESIITAEVLAEIHLAIESLPESYRLVSVMGYMEGKKNQEIADILGMSVNTVKKQKQRALELLRIKLTPELFSLLLLFIR